MKRAALATLIFFLVFGGLLYLYPPKGFIESQIKQNLKTFGLKDTKFSLKDISFYKMTLEDVQLASGFRFQTLALLYSPLEMLHGRLDDLHIKDLTVTFEQKGEAWVIDGQDVPQENKGGAIIIPDTEQKIVDIPISNIFIENARLNLQASAGKIEIPFDLRWDKNEKTFTLKNEDLIFTAQGRIFTAKRGQIILVFEDNKWQGDWSLSDIVSPEMPILSAGGRITVEKQNMHMRGQLQSQDHSAQISFDMQLPLENTKAITLSVNNGEMKWASGYIRIKQANIPLDGHRKIAATVEAENIDLQSLLSLMTGQDIVASGTISGKLPVTFAPDGAIGLQKSRLAANDKGTITVPSALVPGEGMQIDLTRQILDGFSYDTLSMDVEETKDGRVAIILNIAGNNPKVYDGRAVKLNVRLGGDVLEFLQSNIRMLMQPEAILQQEKR